jgi:two-component system sensor histidine kinase ResE
VVRVAGALCVARTVVAFTRRSVRFRFLAGFAGLLVAVVLSVSVAIGTVIDRNLREGATARLVGQADDARERLVDLAANEVQRLVILSDVGGQIAATIERGDSLAPALVRELRKRIFPEVDFILFLDPRGEVRGRSGVTGGGAVEVVGTDVVDFALRQATEVSSLDSLPGGGLALIGVAPIREPGNPRPAGFAVAGFQVGPDLLERAVLVAGRDTRAAAYQGFRGRPPQLVAAVGFPPTSSLVPPDALRQVYGRFLQGAETEGAALDLGGTEHFAALAPLRQSVGPVVGIMVVAEPAGVLAATQAAVNRILFVATVAVVVLAFLIALAAARRITRPLLSLTEAARRVQAGDLTVKAQVRGEDEVAGLSVAFNRMTASVGSMTEELRTAADEQSRLRARLETVVNSMGDGLIAVDAEARIVTYNPAAAAVVGLPRDEAVGRPLDEVLRVRDAVGGAIAVVDRPPEGMAFVERAGGEPIPVAISSAPLRDSSGGRLGRVYVLRDMSLEYQVERMKRELISNVSHELRTPLTPIIGYSELMTKRDLPTEKAREFAESILESARRLERIVAMLVDFSAIEAGSLAVVTEPLQVASVVDEAVSAWRQRTDRHDFEVEAADELPPAQVSPSLFRRMLDELLDNAVKYSPEGGKVKVEVAPQNSGGRRMLGVRVSDEGIGIEPGDLARIFQDFRQVDASDTRAFGGLGLGLTFVQRLAQAQGGEVRAESEPGRGSAFSFTVPVADGQRGTG